MISIGLAMTACMGWGIADFIGGLKSRDIPTLMILIISNGVGLCLLGAILAGSAKPVTSDPSLAWAVPAGIVGIGAMYLLYKSLSMGTMSILAPVSATGVILPVIWGIINGDQLTVLTMAGMAVAFAGTLLAVMEPTKENHRSRWTKGFGHALGAAVCIGFYFILMDKASGTDPLWASMIMRSSTFAFLIPVILVARIPFALKARHLPVIVLMGMVDTMAAFAFAMAAQSGMLSIVALISSLYPAVTVLLSAVIIRERINRIQTTGVVLAIAGVVLISGV